MTRKHSIFRTLIAVSLWMCAALACAQQIPFAQPSPSFDPYAAQPGGVIPGPALPPGSPTFQQELPVFLAGFPVRFVLFGEFLYLRGSDAAMTSYAVPVNGAVVPPPIPAVPMGPVAHIEQGFQPGFRVGSEWVWNDYSRWVASYTSLDLKTTDTVSVDPASPLALQALVLHPSTTAADDYWLTAGASGDVKMRLADIEYRRVFVEDWYRWDFLVGARYANLDQKFRSEFTNSTTTEVVDAAVDFDGGGIRFGTRGDWRSSQHGFFIYAQATTSFVAGRFTSRYSQTDSFLDTVANTSRKDDRIINLTDAELGVGWHSQSRRWWFSGGYLFNAWSDVVSSAGLIRTAQATSFAPIRERMTFDGLTARGEFRF
jgi:hypothetical protein